MQETAGLAWKVVGKPIKLGDKWRIRWLNGVRVILSNSAVAEIEARRPTGGKERSSLCSGKEA